MYTYYKYLDKFHIEPKEWKDLFEYLQFVDTEGIISSIVTEESK